MVIDIAAALAAHREAINAVETLGDALQAVAQRMNATFEDGGTVFACGNGGSASDAQHFAAELTGRYQLERPGYSAMALTTDSSALTSIGNDYGFEQIFSRQLEALARHGDLLFAISTSGNSTNVVRAVLHARENGIRSVGLLGRDGGALAELVDHPLIVPVEATARIQEAHILMLHLLCEAFEP